MTTRDLAAAYSLVPGIDTDLVEPDQPPMRGHEHPPETPMRALWRAVLDDACRLYLGRAYVPPGHDRQRVEAEARAWVDSDSTEPRSFLVVCDFLGVEPGGLRRRLRDTLASGQRTQMQRRGKVRRGRIAA